MLHILSSSGYHYLRQFGCLVYKTLIRMSIQKTSFLLLAILGSVLAMAQSRTITGVVKDESGQPLSNISVVVKGTNIGTTTNNAGAYSISVPSNARTLVFTAV